LKFESVQVCECSELATRTEDAPARSGSAGKVGESLRNGAGRIVSAVLLSWEFAPDAQAQQGSGFPAPVTAPLVEGQPAQFTPTSSPAPESNLTVPPTVLVFTSADRFVPRTVPDVTVVDDLVDNVPDERMATISHSLPASGRSGPLKSLRVDMTRAAGLRHALRGPEPFRNLPSPPQQQGM